MFALYKLFNIRLFSVRFQGFYLCFIHILKKLLTFLCLNIIHFLSQNNLFNVDINSINTNKGNKPNGQPEGTNKEKNFKSCI